MSWDFLFKCDMYRVEIIILLLFSLCSCQQGEKGEEIGLFHKQIDLGENLILGAPVDMKCVDDNLIIIDANSDAFFHTKIICAVLVYNGCFYFVFIYTLRQ